MTGHPPTPSRRRLLRSVGATGALLGGLGGLGSARADAGADVRVLTRNLGLGTRLARLLNAGGGETAPRRVYDRFRDVVESAVPTRMAALADEIATERPAFVGLQEAAVLRRGTSDYAGGSPPNADRVVVDFLAELRESLASATDTGYRPVARVRNADEEFPAESPEGERFDVRLTDRDVVLAREDVEPVETETGNYAVNVVIELDDATVLSVDRGYCIVEAKVGRTRLWVANTHLESVSSLVRRFQAGELLGRLAVVPGPTVVLGDFNSAPTDEEPSAYHAMTEAYVDAWADDDRGGEGDGTETATSDSDATGDGDTCCQSPTLRNESSQLDERVDHVFHDGPVETLGARRVGGATEDRVHAQVGAEEVGLWPSDHAGVVADLRVHRES